MVRESHFSSYFVSFKFNRKRILIMKRNHSSFLWLILLPFILSGIIFSQSCFLFIQFQPLMLCPLFHSSYIISQPLHLPSLVSLCLSVIVISSQLVYHLSLSTILSLLTVIYYSLPNQCQPLVSYIGVLGRCLSKGCHIVATQYRRYPATECQPLDTQPYSLLYTESS